MRAKTSILLLILIGFLVYINSLLNGFIGDDFDQIIQNGQMLSISNIPSFFIGSTYYKEEIGQFVGLYYRPLMISTYALINTVFKTDPLFYHLPQILLFITNSILLYFLLKKFFKEVPAFLGALIFLIHPINNETAVYIANLQEALFFFFGILSLLLITSKIKRGWNIKDQILISVLLLLTLFSKESGILFFLIISLYLYLFDLSKLRRFILLSFIPIAIYSIFRFVIADIHFKSLSMSPISNADFTTRLLNMPKIVFYYLKTAAFPKDLSIDQIWIVKSINFSDFYLPFILDLMLFSCLIFFAYYLNKKKKTYFKTYLFFFIWFILGISLHLQIFALDMTVADRWFYLPMAGIIGMSGCITKSLKINNKHYKKIAVFLTIIIIFAFATRTFIRNFDWFNTFTLYKHDIKVTNGNAFLENGLGSEYIKQSKYKEAKPYIESSIKSYPYFGNLNNMAILYTHEKNIPKAKEYFKKAMEKDANYMVRQNYAYFLLFIAKDPKEAKVFTQNLLKHFPKSSKLWLVLSLAEYELGNKKEAIDAIKKSYAIKPDNQNSKVYSKLEKNLNFQIQEIIN